MPMRSALIPVLLGLLLILLSGCDPEQISPRLRGIIPTTVPTATPPPTPTRTDETAIPFTSFAVNSIRSLPAGLGIPDQTELAQDRLLLIPEELPILTTDHMPKVTEGEQVDPFHGQGPQLFLATTRDELAPFQMLLAPEALNALDELDFEQYAVVALFAGLIGPANRPYIQRIAVPFGEPSLTAYASIDIGSSGPPATRFPYHIVLIDRNDVPFVLNRETQVTPVISRILRVAAASLTAQTHTSLLRR